MYMCIHALVELSRYCLDVDVCGSVRRYMRCCYNICSPGSHKMKASDHSICVVPATAVEILLTLAQYISSTPCMLSQQTAAAFLFGWTELSERRIAERVHVCVQKRPALAWANPEIEEWLSKRKSPL